MWWMVVDARQRGVTVWGWLLGTVLLGVSVPLLYLIVRELAREPEPVWG